MSRDVDVIIIGAGHNSLAAALYLARAGLKVLVFEKSQRPGGAVKTAEITRPGCGLHATSGYLAAREVLRKI